MLDRTRLLCKIAILYLKTLVSLSLKIIYSLIYLPVTCVIRFFYHAAVENNLYFIYGRVLALSLIHGGSGPLCFSRLLYNQILDLPREFSSALLQPSAVHDQVIRV